MFKNVFQNATVIVKYSWGVFRALSQMIALSYGSMDAPTSENLLYPSFKQEPSLNSPAVKHFCTKWCSCATDYVEMWIVMVSMVSGCIMYTVLVANATTMIANVDPAAKEYKSKVPQSDTILQE